MAWNEPGGSGDKDPWGGRGQDQGPPDLDEIVKKMQDKVTHIFGGKGGGGGGGSSANAGLIGILIIVALVVWLLSGIYIVDSAERGVIQRFGKYTSTTMPGPHWHLPYPIETVELVNVDQINTMEIGYRSGGGAQAGGSVPSESLMLTQDENIVDIQFAVQYRVKDARDYLFNVRNPVSTLQQATESAVREIVGKSKMDFVLTEGRSAIADRAEVLIQEIVDRYQTGLLVTSVNMQKAQPPEQVRAAFEDAIKAREDQQRLVNEAQAYSNDIIPRARGKAARMIEEAQGYKQRVVAEAEGEASRFEDLLTEYKKAPEVTRKRLYIDSVESVLNNSSKVMVDVEGGSNLMYLPLDQLMKQRSEGGQSVQSFQPTEMPSSSSSSRSSQSARDRENLRGRGRP